MLKLKLEGATINELRKAAIIALDIVALDIGDVREEAVKLADIVNETADESLKEVKQFNAMAATVGTVEPEKDATGPLTDESATKPEPKKRAPRKSAKLIEMADAIEDTKPINLEEVKKAFDSYIAKFGLEAAKTDGPVILDRIYGAGVIAKVRDIPENDIPRLGRVIAALEGAILTNEFKRPQVQ